MLFGQLARKVCIILFATTTIHPLPRQAAVTGTPRLLHQSSNVPGQHSRPGSASNQPGFRYSPSIRIRAWRRALDWSIETSFCPNADSAPGNASAVHAEVGFGIVGEPLRSEATEGFAGQACRAVAISVATVLESLSADGARRQRYAVWRVDAHIPPFAGRVVGGWFRGGRLCCRLSLLLLFLLLLLRGHVGRETQGCETADQERMRCAPVDPFTEPPGQLIPLVIVHAVPRAHGSR